MNERIPNFHRTALSLAAAVSLLSACGSVGDTTAVKQAAELAIDCKTREALAAVDRASQGGGLSSNIADLQRVVILRDAGRMSEADAAMAARNKRAGADAKAAAEAEQSVANAIEQLRAERMKQTGRSTCP
jgi:hypothetical protein